MNRSLYVGALFLGVMSLSIQAREKTSGADGRQKGKASWYDESSGRRTASGERMDSSAMTAAHRTLPFGTKVRVTHLRNSSSVIVRINDRGPYTKGRIIDISKAAGRELKMIKSGTAQVAIEVVPE